MGNHKRVCGSDAPVTQWYGAGDEKIGSIVGKGSKTGKELKAQFLSKTPALKHLLKAVQTKAKEQNYLTGLDGRILHIRSSHAALNTLLQSAGAIAVKKATVLWDQLMQQHGYIWGQDYALVAHIHDELQMQVREEIADECGRLAVQAIRAAGEYFGFRCPLDGEYRVGNNWAETH